MFGPTDPKKGGLFGAAAALDKSDKDKKPDFHDFKTTTGFNNVKAFEYSAQ